MSTQVDSVSLSIIANTYIQFQEFQQPQPQEIVPEVQVLQNASSVSVTDNILPVAQQVPPISEADISEADISKLQNILDFTKTFDFGVLKVKIADTPMTTQPQLLYFKNDMSGSMQDPCSDGRTKMHHSNHTTSNILRLAAESEGAEIWVQVDAFDDKVDRIIPPQRVTKDNLAQLVNLINKIAPRNCTNLELALHDSKEQIAQFKEQHPEFTVTHIFTTDGQATAGSQDDSYLAECVDPSHSNIFIGFGLDHSAPTLASLSSRKHAAYYFIDKIENGGLVFGEVIHSILYKAVTDITLSTENAEIYDYRTNQWAKTLQIDSLAGDAEKTYHLRIPYNMQIYDVEVKISGKIPSQPNSRSSLLGTALCIPQLINEEGAYDPPRLDLSKYIFRQRTQELLYEAQETQPGRSIKDLKKKMRDFLTIMKTYAENHNLTDDSTIKSLNDDLVIVIRTLGTQYQAMYSVARSNSNGRECSYNVSEVPSAPRRRPGGLRRSIALNDYQDQAEDQEQQQAEDEVVDELQILSQGPLARTHTTPRQLTLMRSCSAGTQAENLLDNEQ